MTPREKRPSIPFRKAGGFTALEIIVTVVVLSILSAYAVPKLFGLKDQADETEETMKIQDLASKHAKEMLEQGKRNGSLPTLGGTVGYRPEVVSEPAPEQAPVLVDYSFAFFSESAATAGGEGGWLDIAPGLVRDAYDFVPGDSQMLCDGAQIWLLFKGRSDPTHIYWITSTTYYLKARAFEASIISGAPSSGASPSDEVPKCRAKYTSSLVSNSTSMPSASTLASLRIRPGHVEWITDTGRFRHYSDVGIREDWTLRIASDTPGAGSRVRDIPPQKYRATCSPYVQRHGTPYVLRGLTSSWSNANMPTWAGGTDSRIMSGDNGKEKSYWYGVETTNLRVIQASPLISALDGKRPSEVLVGAYCERVGPAPETPHADPGDPGAYPMASDGSGYCLGKGRKLPTYKDGAGTPTASPSDSVAELGTEAIDDPTNCP